MTFTACPCPTYLYCGETRPNSAVNLDLVTNLYKSDLAGAPALTFCFLNGERLQWVFESRTRRDQSLITLTTALNQDALESFVASQRQAGLSKPVRPDIRIGYEEDGEIE